MSKSAIHHLAITDESGLVAAAFPESTVQIWSWKTREQLSQFDTIMDDGGRRLAMTDDGRICIAGSFRRGLATYSIPDGNLLWHRKDLRQVQYDGNRVAKTVNGVTTRYLVDDLNPTGYAQVVEESVNGSVQRAYSYGLQRIDELQLVNNAWTASFYGYDGFGSVRQLTNTAGAVTDTYDYDAFGNLLSQTGSTPNSYLYRGEQLDADLGLYYLRARYYNPATGRFLSRDPEDGKSVNPKSLHKYLYAGGDPVNGWDPSGRVDLEEYALFVIEKENALVEPALFGKGIGECVTSALESNAGLLNDLLAGNATSETGQGIANVLAQCVDDEIKDQLGPILSRTF